MCEIAVSISMNADSWCKTAKKLVQQQVFSFKVDLFVRTSQGPSTTTGVSEVYCNFGVLTGQVMPGCHALLYAPVHSPACH